MLHTPFFAGGVVDGFCVFCFYLRAALTAGDEGLGLAVGFGFVFLIGVFDFFGPTLTSLKVNEVDLTKCNSILTYTVWLLMVSYF